MILLNVFKLYEITGIELGDLLRIFCTESDTYGFLFFSIASQSSVNLFFVDTDI